MNAAQPYLKGSFLLDEQYFHECHLLCNMLSPSRTPNILRSAWKGELEKTKDNYVVVPRGLKPAVPRTWLLSAFVYQWPKKMSPSFLLEVRNSK